MMGVKLSKGLCPSSRVEQSTHNPTIKDSTAADAGSGKQKKLGKVMETRVSEELRLCQTNKEARDILGPVFDPGLIKIIHYWGSSLSTQQVVFLKQPVKYTVKNFCNRYPG